MNQENGRLRVIQIAGAGRCAGFRYDGEYTVQKPFSTAPST